MVRFTPVFAPLVGFIVAAICAPAGVSGAFLLLPFQVSVLGFSAPSVTATNLVYNVLATPGGIETYRRTGRLDYTLAKLVTAGTLPGVLAGAVMRIHLFRSASAFKLFIGVVLLALGIKLFLDVGASVRRFPTSDTSPNPRRGIIILVSFVVGLVGGIYGIGGGSIIAPYMVAIIGLSVYRVAGAALLATFVTSIVGVAFYQVVAWTGQEPVAPDWGLGILFGIGGLLGSYVGASLQRRIAEWGIKSLIGALVTALGLNYLVSARRR